MQLESFFMDKDMVCDKTTTENETKEKERQRSGRCRVEMLLIEQMSNSL